jgi:quinol monooxygenase YgiN
MPALGFLVEFEAQPGREQALADFLVEAKALIDAEPGTVAWFAFRRGERSFGIFDAFRTEDDRETHLHGEVRRALVARGGDLLAVPPVITPVDLVATKLP